MPELRAEAAQAVAAAYRARRDAGFNLANPVCPYDLALKLGMEVQLAPIPSLEGLFTEGSVPLVLLSCLRPAGRRRFTCAHELGHWLLGHGTQLDELRAERGLARRIDPKERMADIFAGTLLMPRPAVQEALKLRSWTAVGLTPEQTYTMASLFGVGYLTFVRHLQSTLGIITQVIADSLRSQELRAIRTRILGNIPARDLHVMDNHWSGRALDVEVGDLVMAPQQSQVEGDCLDAQPTATGRTLFSARSPGLDRIEWGSGSSYVRVSRFQYHGRAIYRHMPEEEGDND